MGSSLILTPEKTDGGSGGGGTIGGSIAVNQVAFGTGVNTIGGVANLLWINGTQTFAVNGNVYFTGGAIILGQQTTTAINYNVLVSDFLIRVVPVPPISITITLPAVGTANTGQVFVIKDGNGFAGVGTELIVSAQAGETIDGTLNKSFNIARTSITVRNTGLTWDII